MNDRIDRTDRPASPPTTPGSATLPADCATFRGDLSAYLDGGMDEAARRTADAHVAACPDCRHLADEVEASERTMALGLDEDAAAPLPPGFTGAILARTVHEAQVAGRITRPGVGSPGGLVPWLGWVAAAALVVFNLAVWNVDGPSTATPRERAIDGPPATVPASWQVSATLATPADAAMPVTPTEHTDFAALFSAATLLDSFAEVTGDPAEAADFAARVIAYDELLPRLAAIARDLPPEAAATVELTRGLLEDLASGDARTHARLTQRLAAGELTAALRRLELRLVGSV